MVNNSGLNIMPFLTEPYPREDWTTTEPVDYFARWRNTSRSNLEPTWSMFENPHSPAACGKWLAPSLLPIPYILATSRLYRFGLLNLSVVVFQKRFRGRLAVVTT